MIFKSEGESNIKRLTTEAPRNEIDPGSPFDYRREITKAHKEMIQEDLRAALAAPHRIGDYLAIAAAARYLGVEIPPLSEKNEVRILERLAPIIRESAQWGATAEFDIISDAALYDRSLLDKLPRKCLDDLESLKNRFTPVPLDLTELAALNILKSGNDMPPRSKGMVTALNERKFSTLSDSARWLAFYNLARARIGGITELPHLDADDWRAIRTNILSKTQEEGLPTYFFHARVLAAKDVYVDDDGLHIIDEDHEPAASSERSVPPRKNI